MTVAAATFNAARTAENFRAWYAESPEAAKTYLQAVAVRAGNVTALQAIDQFKADANFGATAANVFAQIEAAGIAAVQAARTGTLGWEAKGPPKAPPTITGELVMTNGVPTLKTDVGTFTLRSVNPVGANDVSAFAGRVVTVRGWPDAQWQPGTQGTLLAEEWAPGTSDAFVTGRVVANGTGDVFVRINPMKQVKLTDPTLKAALGAFNDLGVILSGPIEQVGAELHYTGTGGDYYILGGFSAAGTPAEQAGSVTFNLQLAHGKSLQTTLPKAAWDGVARVQRHYLFGHIEGGHFVGKGLTPTAGGWMSPTYEAGTESTKFIQHAVPTGHTTYTAEQARFGM